MSTTVHYWAASWEEDAGGAFGATRSGSLGSFDSEEKAKQACQIETERYQRENYKRVARPLPWGRSIERVYAWDCENPCYDGRTFYIDSCTLVIE